jgi:pimeloyl-ACP methyl ester carboxylesterase
LATLTLDGLELNYHQFDPVEAGSGESDGDLILIHGLAANMGFWYFSLAPAFAKTWRVTMLDLRGHGRSSMPASGYHFAQLAGDLKALLDHLHIDQAHILGHSLGGAVATHFACYHPDRVKSLILADVRLKLFQPELNPTDWALWRKYEPELTAVGIKIDPHTHEMGFQLLAEIARLQIESPELSEKAQQTLPISSLFAAFSPSEKGRQRSAQQFLKLIQTTTLVRDLNHEEITIDQLKALQLPILAVYGEFSQSLSTLNGLKSLFPHLIVERVPGAGHFFPLSKPELLIGPVQAFLTGSSAVRDQLIEP